MSATEAQLGLGLERDFDSDFTLRVGFIRPLSSEFTSRIELEVELKLVSETLAFHSVRIPPNYR